MAWHMNSVHCEYVVKEQEEKPFLNLDDSDATD
jgi:hypothetical protein